MESHDITATDKNDVKLPTIASGTSPAEHSRSLLRGRVLVTVGLILLVTFALVTLLVVFADPLAFDVPITKELQEIDYGPFGWLMAAVSAPGFLPWNFIFPAVLIGGLLLLRHGLEALFLFLASIATASAELIKHFVQRSRPGADVVNVVHQLTSYSFPSGHVTQYTLVFGFCFYLAFTLVKPGFLRNILLVLTGAMIVLVAPSRIWLGQHWASDVLGGYALGFGLLALVIWGYRGWQARIVEQRSTVQHSK
ncbi:MAG: phosphatase PAP2 family protein [Chloroflexia bacterium]